MSAPVDWAVVGGASMLAYVALLCWGDGRGLVPAAVAVLAPLCNWPHFAASTHRLYHSRDNVRQYPMTALVVPVLVAAGLGWAFAAPTTIAPAFVKLVLLWSPYHFSGQSLGIALVYARRAGLTVGRAERLTLGGFIFTAFLAMTAHAETGPGMRHYLGVDHPRLGLPAWVGDGLDVAVVAFGLATAAAMWRWGRREGRLVPAIVYLPAAAQGLWFVAGRQADAFQLLVPFFHSAQYLFVAWAVQLKERLATRTTAPSVLTVASESARWWSLNVMLGVGLFVGFPHLCALGGCEVTFAMAVTSSAVQLHHFFVDGVIWKLKNPRVGGLLLGGVRDLLRPVPVPVKVAG